MLNVDMLINGRARTTSVIYFRGGVVPAGFEYDGMSIPRLFWSIAGHPFQGRGMRAGAIHDYLYSIDHLYAYSNVPTARTRRQCDRILYIELLIANRRYYRANPAFFILRKIADCRCYVKYLAVRMFGWRYFRK